MASPLPRPRGPLSERLLHLLPRPVDDDVPVTTRADGSDDAAISLWLLHELHYRGLEGVEERWEWSPALAGVRRGLEDDLEQRLRRRFAAADLGSAAEVADPAEQLLALAAGHDGPSLARHVQRTATYDEVVELMRQRSVYHLKEADPTAWVVARLDAAPKAALMQVQYDEYGGGDVRRLHHGLFERGLAASGIDAGYGVHVDSATTEVLEQNNAVTMFGLHRRLRGAALGHLAAFEATSSLPSRQMAQGLRRLGFADELVAYYDEHVEADAVHEQLAAHEICGALVTAEPHLRDDVLLGAWSCLDLEARTATALLDSWATAAA